MTLMTGILFGLMAISAVLEGTSTSLSTSLMSIAFSELNSIQLSQSDPCPSTLLKLNYPSTCKKKERTTINRRRPSLTMSLGIGNKIPTKFK